MRAAYAVRAECRPSQQFTACDDHALTQNSIPALTGAKSTVWDLCFKPDGSQLICAVNNRVLIYDTEGVKGEGRLIKSCKGHQDTVYCVDFSHDGKVRAT